MATVERVHEEQPIELARRGVRAWARSVARRTGAGLRAATPYGALAFLAASVVAPVAGAGLGASAEIAAGLNQIGGMGANYLADVLAGTANRTRGERLTAEELRDAVAADLLPRLEAADENGRLLREEVAAVLREVDAVGVALAESAGQDSRAQEAIALAFGALGSEVGELRWILAEVARSLTALQQRLAEQGSARREQLTLSRQALVMIAQLRHELRDKAAPAVTATGDEGSTAAEPDDVSPYPGLASFQPTDADRFFGRTAMVSALVGRLAEQAVGAPPLALIGISGAGKSSLLRAGLLPAVAAGALGDEAAAWPWLLMTPGTDPLAELVRRAAELSGGDPGEELDRVRADPARFGELAGAAGATGRLLIVVDQFEELFTRCADPAEREAFALALSSAAPALVVFAVRADFYQGCTQLPPLARALGDQVVLGPMSADELRSAVLEPAARAGLTVEPGLVQVLLTDLGERPGRPYDPGALPLLGHALRATWTQREGRRLTVEGYRRTGGIRHALAETAERIYLGLDPDGRQALRAALLSLVAIADDRVVVRRLGARSAVAAPVLDRLVEARLVTAYEDTVEISHEALLTGWPRLAGWLDEAREEILLRQQLAEATREWQRGEDPEALWRGVRLDRATEWAASRDDLSEPERRFLAAGAAAAETDRLARLRNARRLRRLAAGLAGALLVAVSGGLIAVDQRDTAVDRERQALAGQDAAQSLATGESNQLEAMSLALRSWATYPTVEARGALLSSQMLSHLGRLGTEPGGQSVALSSDGSLAAVGHADGTVRLWDTATLTRHGTALRATGTGAVPEFLAFSPDGRFLATSTFEINGLRVWELPSGRLRHILPGGGALAWRPDSSAVLANRTDGAAGLPIGAWDPVTGRRTASVPGIRQVANSLAVSGDGRYLAMGTGSDGGGGQVWRLADGAPLARIPDAWEVVFTAAGVLISSGWDGRIRRWELPSGRELRSLTEDTHSRLPQRLAVTAEQNLLATAPGHRPNVEVRDAVTGDTYAGQYGFVGTVSDVAASANGKVIAATGRDGVTTLWSRSSNWLTHPNVVASVAFDPTGRQLATMALDDTVRIWDVAGRTVVASIPGKAPPTALSYAPDGTLVIASTDGAIRLRDPSGTIRTVPSFGAGVTVQDAVASPDGSSLVVVTAPEEELLEQQSLLLRLLDIRTLRQRSAVDLGNVVITRPEFSPTGDRIYLGVAQTTRQGTVITTRPSVRSWRTAGLTPLASVADGRGVNGLAVSPDGRQLATVGISNHIELRDPDTLRVVREFAPHTSELRTVAFSPDQRVLATVTLLDPVIRLWDARTGAPVARLSGHVAPPNSIAFRPGGGLLATGSPDTSLLLWQLDPAAVAGELCATLRLNRRPCG